MEQNAFSPLAPSSVSWPVFLGSPRLQTGRGHWHKDGGRERTRTPDWPGTAKLHFIKVGLKRGDSSPPLCYVLPGHVHVLSGPLAFIVYQGGWRVRVRGEQA